MQQASANVSDSFSFRFRQLFWSHRKAIRVQLTRPRGGVEHRSRSKKSHATRLQISTKSTWTARSLQTSLLEEKYPVLRISHFTSCVCVLTEVCMQCDQGITGSRQHLFLKRKVTFTWRVRYNLVKIYYLCSPLYCNINQRTLWVALCREDGTSSPQYSIF